MIKRLLIPFAILGGLGIAAASLMNPPVIMVSMPNANAPTAPGSMAYDYTNNMLHAAQNGADAMVPLFTITPANNDPVCWVVSGSNFKLGNTGCASGSSTVQTAVVTVSSAQIKTLNASPVTIVAAQGAGTFIQFVSATVEFVCSGCTQYTSGAPLLFKTGTGYSSAQDSAVNFDSLAATGIIDGWVNPSGGAAYLGLSSALLNAPLRFVNDGGPEFATGTGTLIIHCSYIVHSGL